MSKTVTIAHQAGAFLQTLSPDQRQKALLDPGSPGRTDWHYIPKPRLGLPWKEMNAEQKKEAESLLRASLSKAGYDKIETIRSLEPILGQMEGGNAGRDPGLYYFVFFGEPDDAKDWSWRYEGHHISLTFAFHQGRLVASTPQFLGSNPAQVAGGPLKGTRVLAKEQDLAFQLAESLTPTQLSEAHIATAAPADIVTSNARRASIEGHKGVPYKDLSPDQKKLLLDLLRAHAEVQSEKEQARRLSLILSEEIDHIVFAWMGPIQRKGRHYYRIQGENLLVEYDNTQEDGNHIHTVWRNLKEDFGDPLLDHYSHDHHHKK